MLFTQQRECIRGNKRTVRLEQLICENERCGQSTKALYKVGIKLHVSATNHQPGRTIRIQKGVNFETAIQV